MAAVYHNNMRLRTRGEECWSRVKILQRYGYIFLIEHDYTDKTSRATNILKEQLDIFGNVLICVLAESQERRSIPLSCLYCKYEARASNQLAQHKVWERREKATVAWLCQKVTISAYQYLYSSLINTLYISWQLPGNTQRLQEVAGPGQEIVRQIIPRKTINCGFYVVSLENGKK